MTSNWKIILALLLTLLEHVLGILEDVPLSVK